jgi:hypothetical protein
MTCCGTPVPHRPEVQRIEPLLVGQRSRLASVSLLPPDLANAGSFFEMNAWYENNIGDC